ncbi:MAG: phytochelatin synthase family protein [Proteobacteria bacterium]|nr:phytochelatin synthase family protein [Pseudomonadota bacterium]MBU1389988.1 phytochelatin synthase family protein [Pseudomonadota bacterium]MBU1545061.1 phytochelatin synthase family protein [Pseudomonadota bacterium]MBU2480894.1 phytochelatin synthase family protein [Pseudomonadota bacterium]
MMLLKWVIRPYLYFQYLFSKFARTGAFGKDHAEYMTAPYQNTGNSVKDGLFRHHVKQFHESSCSVASVVSVINTLLESQGKLTGLPLTQHDLLETVRAAHWKERMGKDGYKGRRGLPLEVLGQVVKASLDVHKIQYRSVEIVQTLKNRKKSVQIKQDLKTRLERFEKQGDSIIIAHFDQGSFLPELHIPHISPVGGFDPASESVTILDVDSTQDYPYKVSLETFYKGVSYDYNYMFRRYGYGEGGYVFIQL